MNFKYDNIDDYDTYKINYELIGIMPETKYEHAPEDRFFSPKEALEKGNLFKDLYKPYKNYHYRQLEPKNEKEMLMRGIMEFDFAIAELNLYLDMYPQDTKAFNLFKEYVKKYKRFKEEYSMKYGPLELTDDFGMTYDWNKDPWSWEVKDYV